jgi:uncharacterized protein
MLYVQEGGGRNPNGACAYSAMASRSRSYRTITNINFKSFERRLSNFDRSLRPVWKLVNQSQIAFDRVSTAQDYFVQLIASCRYNPDPALQARQQFSAKSRSVPEETVDQTRPLAVVTGASSGIGYELAAQFAKNGFDIFVVAEDDRLKGAAQRLAKYGTSVEQLQADLSTADGVQSVYDELHSRGRVPDALAINAGVGVQGPFVESSLDDQLNLVNLNVTSAVYLTHRVLQDMVANHRGRILFTSSIAATSPGPFEATYNASKSFLKSFAAAIRNELKDSGVTVTTLMPGETETDFFRRAGAEDTKLGTSEKDDPAQVAQEGFDALMAGEDQVVAGSFKNKVQATISHVIPDSVAADIHRKKSEPGSANK